jgi:hypothetical protein
VRWTRYTAFRSPVPAALRAQGASRMSEIVETLLDTAFQDTELLIQNDGKGDNFQVPRNVDFIFYAPTKEKADVVASFINDNRYAEASYDDVEGQFRILAVVHMAPTQHVLCSVSGLMACVAKIFSVEYDGWGTTIERT